MCIRDRYETDITDKRELQIRDAMGDILEQLPLALTLSLIHIYCWLKEVGIMNYPFENDTSAVIKKLARKSVRFDKKKNLFCLSALTVFSTYPARGREGSARWIPLRRSERQSGRQSFLPGSKGG